MPSMYPSVLSFAISLSNAAVALRLSVRLLHLFAVLRKNTQIEDSLEESV